MKMTNQRRTILEILRQHSRYLTADELYTQIRTILPRISLATVYRNLEILAETGIIKKLEVGGQRKCFHHDIHQQDYVVCVQCQRVEQLSLDRNLLALGEIRAHTGYSIQGCQIEISGICPECRKNKQAKEK